MTADASLTLVVVHASTNDTSQAKTPESDSVVGVSAGASRAPSSRKLKITFARVLAAFREECDRRGITPEEVATYTPCWGQTRISQDDYGTSTSPERQMRDMIDWMITWRFRPIGWLSEEDQTAYQIQHRPRREFDRLFEQFEDDLVPAKDIVCYTLDRFARRRLQGEIWLQMMLQKGLNLHEACEGAPRPLCDKEDGFAREWANAERESRKKALRVENSHKHLARAGKPITQMNALGHVPVYEERRVQGGIRRVQVGATAHPVEGPLLREAAQMRLAGGTWAQAARHVTGLGLRSRSGKPLNRQTLRRILISPRTAGLVQFKGVLYPEDRVPTAIEPILSYDDWRKLRELSDRPQAPGPKSHLGTRFLRCGVCGARMRRYGDRYACSKPDVAEMQLHSLSDGQPNTLSRDGRRHVSITGPAADAFIAELTLAIFDQPELVERSADLASEEPASADRLQFESEKRRLMEERERLIRIHLKGDLSEAEYDALSDQLATSLSAAQAALDELDPPENAIELPRQDLRAIWDSQPVEWQTEWADKVIVDITITPSTKIFSDLEQRFIPAFREGCEVPEELVEMVRDRVCERRTVEHGREPADINERILVLHQAGLAYDEIADTMDGDGLIRANGMPWTAYTIRRRLVDVHRRLGKKLKANPSGRRTQVPFETREVIWLLRGQGKGWTAIARELEEIGIRRPTGTPYLRQHVKTIATSHREEMERRAAVRGRPPATTPELRRRLLLLSESGASLAKIGRHLEEQGIPTPSGKKKWARSSVLYMIDTARFERAALSAASSEEFQQAARTKPAYLSLEVRLQLVALRDEGKFYREIAEWLDGRGIPTPGGAARWSKEYVRSAIIETRREIQAEAIRRETRNRLPADGSSQSTAA